MTPKEKAIELLHKHSDKMFNLRDGYNYIDFYEAVKQCALIAVDEILWELIKYADNLGQYAVVNVSFWQEVKQEIEKL